MLFAHEERSMENIPPTFKTLKQHVMLFFPLIKKNPVCASEKEVISSVSSS